MADSVFVLALPTSSGVGADGDGGGDANSVSNGSAPARNAASAPSFDAPSVHRLFEPSKDSYFSRNYVADSGASSSGAASAAESRPRVQFSERSRALLEESNKLLESIDRRHGSGLMGSSSSGEKSASAGGSAVYRRTRRGQSPREESPFTETDYEPSAVVRYPSQPPRFPRIDFDDMLEDELSDRRPAWRQLQDSVRDSYRRPKRTAERQRELYDAREAHVNETHQRRRAAAARSQSPFSQHLDGESFLPRAPSWMASGAMQPRGLSADPTGSGPYAAPAVGQSRGLESDSRPSSDGYSRYDRLVGDIEARLLKVSILPDHMKTVTKREFRRAPVPPTGSFAEDFVATDAELGIALPRPFYSRPDRSDPDYFDFDLQHSMNLFKRPEGHYVPRGPQPWENKLLHEAMSKGDAPLSGYMFTRGASATTTGIGAASDSAPLSSSVSRDWRSTGTSYLSAALRTPSFWEHRFASIGSQVRDSNPISMDSILRNKPVPNKFTEYRDPDFEDYEDPHTDE